MTTVRIELFFNVLVTFVSLMKVHYLQVTEMFENNNLLFFN